MRSRLRDANLTIWGVTIAAVIALVMPTSSRFPATPRGEDQGSDPSGRSFIGVAIAWGPGYLGGDGCSGRYGVLHRLVGGEGAVGGQPFVFVIILSKFAVPAKYWQKVLLFGIVAALVLRTVFILIGAAALEYFSFTFVLFGAPLIWTAIQLARHKGRGP